MLNLEAQKKHFEDHVATFQDLGKIKILDFKKPGTIDYRIRFIFEEDYCRLHISGDLGHLIATNFNNMRWGKFYSDFATDPGYFESKIDCHDRPLYVYDEDVARSQLEAWMAENGVDDEFTEDHYYDPVSLFVDDVLGGLDYYDGLSSKGVDTLVQLFADCGIDSYEGYSFAADLGKESSGILDLYMLAFRLAYDQLKEKGVIADEASDN